MLFNSLSFQIFFLVVLCCFYLVPPKYRWALLLISSYYFYAQWNLKYTGLIALTSISTYLGGITIARFQDYKKITLIAVLSLNLFLLIFFKYFNFLIDTINSLLASHIEKIDPIHVLLPVGISFYTFQAMGYLIDVYRKEIPAEKNIGHFLLFVSFFPQLVAGPIERFKDLMPQLKRLHGATMGQIKSGFQLMLWGYFKKIVIADRLAMFVNDVYGKPGGADDIQIVVATIFFGFQIYCDFSGYSDIAIGIGRVLGVRLTMNFNRPYFSFSIQEFWRKWHITLSFWFRDYLYKPLGGNRRGNIRLFLNLSVVFLLCGLWHGANWTFIAWGALHGLFLIINRIWRNLALSFKSVSNTGAIYFKKFIWKPTSLLLTFSAVMMAWVVFRAQSMSDALNCYRKIIFFRYQPNSFDFIDYQFTVSIVVILFMLLLELMFGDKDFGEFMSEQTIFLRWPIIYACSFAIFIIGIFNLTEFIYFQF